LAARDRDVRTLSRLQPAPVRVSPRALGRLKPVQHAMGEPGRGVRTLSRLQPAPVHAVL